jgi:hypothetical protein
VEYLVAVHGVRIVQSFFYELVENVTENLDISCQLFDVDVMNDKKELKNILVTVVLEKTFRFNFILDI